MDLNEALDTINNLIGAHGRPLMRFAESLMKLEEVIRELGSWQSAVTDLQRQKGELEKEINDLKKEDETAQQIFTNAKNVADIEMKDLEAAHEQQKVAFEMTRNEQARSWEAKLSELEESHKQKTADLSAEIADLEAEKQKLVDVLSSLKGQIAALKTNLAQFD